jgi:hypothetical protein
MTPMTNPGTDEPQMRSLSLRVVAELDPSALPRILSYFQNLNLIPRRVSAERASSPELHIRVDVSGLSEERMCLITGKVAQLPGVANAFWHDL